ncbi:DNA-binding protein [bacterium]|nr:MAG: DNA-binding protein [bacterium]
MKKLVLIISAVYCFAGFAQNPAFAQGVSSNDLIDQPARYDGKIIAFAGEVIGDIMVRQDFAWLNVSDKNNALGVWVKKDLLKDIIYTGNYKNTGDRVEITGVFNRACSQHGGDMDIHASVLKKIENGASIPYVADLNKRRLSLTLLGIIGGLWILMLLTKR